MSHLLGVERFVVQDTWNEADDVELRDCLESLGGTTTVEYWSEGRILQGDIVGSPNTTLFCDSHIVQKLLLVASSDVVSSYPPELCRFLGRRVEQVTLKDLQMGARRQELPYFCKLAGSNKQVTARVVRSRLDESKFCEQVRSLLSSSDNDNTENDDKISFYVTSVVDFVSEWRLFLGDGKVWGCQEYSLYMVGHRLSNHDHRDGRRMLEIKDVKGGVPQDFVDSILAGSSSMGFVVADVGLTSEGKWCLVECNPPFALSSYDLPVDLYVQYCVAAWKSVQAAVQTQKEGRKYR